MEDTTTETVDELTELVDAAASPFACEGVFTPRAKVKLKFADGATAAFERGRSNELALSALRAHLAPAPFGQGKATRVDASVRKAHQLKADAAAFSVEGFDPAATGILDEVCRMLRLDPSRSFTAALESVQVYPVGGHFTSHKDTPRGANHVATLVVALPSEFAGGELELAHDERRRTVDFGRELRGASSDLAMPWAAFFPDVDHAVRTVTHGHRVTLTYRISSGAKRPRGTAEKRDPSVGERGIGDALRNRLVRAKEDPGCFRFGGVLRVPCAHLYRAEVDTLRRRPLDRDAALTLKGRDAVVALAAIDAGVEVTLVHCLIASEDGSVLESWPLRRFPTSADVARWSRQVGDGREEGAVAFDAPGDPDVESHFAGSPEAFRKLFAGVYSPTGFYGNEASDAEFYVVAVLEVAFARARERTSPGRGRRVRHKTLGTGVVLRSEGDKLVIRFEDGAERTLLQSFVTDA